MPIYAYRCASCGHAQDVLQKMSDPLLTVCPACGAHTFNKQLTAAGFQLKGSGWYVTDFRGGNTGAKKDGAADAAADKAVEKPASTPTDGAGAGAKADKPATADKAAPAPAPAAAPSTPPST